MTNSTLPRIADRLANSKLKETAMYLSISLQISLDMALMYIISAASAAINGKFEFRITEDWDERSCYDYIIFNESGERKSNAVKFGKSPHEEWLSRQKREQESFNRKIKRHNKRTRAKIRTLEKKAEEAGDIESSVIDKKISELEGSIKPLKTSRLFFGNVTPSALIGILDQCKGRISHFEPEGGLINIMCRKDFNIDIFCNSYDGEDIYLDRVNSKSVYIKSPSISLSISAQQHLATKFLQNQNLNNSGLLGRFWFVICQPLAGYRQTNNPSMPKEIRQWWSSKIMSLLDIEDEYDEFGEVKPWKIELAYEAGIRFKEFCDYAESALRPGGALSFSKSWGSKLAGKIIRLAGLLHCIKHDDPRSCPIDEETLQQAISMGEVLTLHAQRAYYFAANGEKIDAGQKVLDWTTGMALRQMNFCFTVQDAYDNVDGFTRKQIKSAVNYLYEQGMLLKSLNAVAQYASQTRVGRKKGPFYILNTSNGPYGNPMLP